MRCTVVLQFDDGEGTAGGRVELMRLHRDTAGPSTGDVGITLTEGKTLLQTVQQDCGVAQLGRYREEQRICRACGALRRLHASHCTSLKTSFGAAFYCRDRWKACECGADMSAPQRHGEAILRVQSAHMERMSGDRTATELGGQRQLAAAIEKARVEGKVSPELRGQVRVTMTAEGAKRVARGERFKVPVYDARAPRARAKTVQAATQRHADRERSR